MTIDNSRGMVEGMTTNAGRAAIDPAIPELMSITEVAELYGVSRQAVHKMIEGGKLPAARAGSTWVVRREVAEGVTVDGELLDTPTGQ